MTDKRLIFKLLLIEDDPSWTKLILETISESDGKLFELKCVGRLQAGLELLTKQNFDAVLLDLSLPDSQGLDTLKRLHTQEPRMPIIILTSSDYKALGIEATQNGAQDYVPKSQFGPVLIERSIHNAIERQRLVNDLDRSVRELWASEMGIRSVIHKMTDGVVIVDREGIVRFVNPSAVSMFGLRAEELVGSSFGFPMVSGESAELDIVRKDGVLVAAEMRVAETRWDGATAYLASLRDITERRELERMKDEFIAMASHELRTPLTAIRGSLVLLAAGKLGALPDAAQRMVDIAANNTDRLVRLINDVLDFERMESGTVPMQKSECHATNLMVQAIEIMQGMAEKAGITLSVSPQPAQLWADPDRIVQVLTNLLSNSIKFSPQDGTISVTAEQLENQMLFRVKDQGSGIPADKLESIFGRFQQVDASDSKAKGGTGLGLAICRQIVEQHEGKIWAESTLGEGSTFCFTLPIRRENDEAD